MPKKTRKRVAPQIDEGHCLGYIESTLGNGRFTIECEDGKKRLGHIRGNMRNRVWIHSGDLVLCSKRSFQDEKVDIVYKYTQSEVVGMYKKSEITKPMYNLYVNGNLHEKPDNDIEFLDVDDDTPEDLNTI